MNLLAQLIGQQTPSITVTQCNRHGALGIVLADDVQVELAHDLGRGQVFDENLISPVGSGTMRRAGAVGVSCSFGH
jgi:hypothetical protein